MMMNNMNQQNTGNNTAPPPIPGQVKYFVAVNGQQSGPFDLTVLKQMVTQGQVTTATLVWKDGMTNWAAAGTVGELSQLFGSVPPPIPQP
jgi:hypothetical protein